MLRIVKTIQFIPPPPRKLAIFILRMIIIDNPLDSVVRLSVVKNLHLFTPLIKDDIFC
jgi:hypothetical protein